MYINIRHIKGIRTSHTEKLQDAGIISLEDLIKATQAENLRDTIDRTGIWRAAILTYGGLARGIERTESEFYKRVRGGRLLFVEDGEEEDSGEDDEEEGRGGEGGSVRRRCSSRNVGLPTKRRVFRRPMNCVERKREDVRIRLRPV